MKRKHALGLLVLLVLLWWLWHRYHNPSTSTSVKVTVNDSGYPEINGQEVRNATDNGVPPAEDWYTFGNRLVRNYNQFI